MRMIWRLLSSSIAETKSERARRSCEGLEGREGGSLGSGLGVTWMLHESYMKVTRKLLVYVCIRVCINPLITYMTALVLA